jgi:hypothetical protein
MLRVKLGDRGAFVRRCPRAMITTLKTFAGVVLAPVHLKRTLLIAFVVGSWLNLFNHGERCCSAR